MGQGRESVISTVDYACTLSNRCIAWECGERLAAGSTGVQPLPPGYGLLVRYAIVLMEASIHFGFGSLFGVTISLLETPH